MKYSIKGQLSLTDETELVSLFNRYTLWRLDVMKSEDKITFEVWLNTVEEKDQMFGELKYYVDMFGEKIDWHKCTHDEPVGTECKIIEEYKGG
jgi:hypothetical protein